MALLPDLRNLGRVANWQDPTFRPDRSVFCQPLRGVNLDTRGDGSANDRTWHYWLTEGGRRNHRTTFCFGFTREGDWSPSAAELRMLADRGFEWIEANVPLKHSCVQAAEPPLSV